ncbi:MAG TPA: peptide ABC transporter substrate-binding protein, partial [Nitrospiria bacterium]|nr:peptide ABC transporter substrate-binding protein [Nitrospiria bacterium]
DRLISEAAADPDPASRRSKYGEAQKILTETDAAIIPLFFSAQNLLVRRNVHGFIPNAMELFSFKTVWKGDQER